MYSSNTPVTTVSMSYQGQGQMYNQYRASTPANVGFSQYGSNTGTHAGYQPQVPQGSSKSMHAGYQQQLPQGSTTSTHAGYQPQLAQGSSTSTHTGYQPHLPPGLTTNTGTRYQQHLQQGTSSPVYAQTSVPSYQQPSQDHYRSQRLPQPAHTPYMQKSMPATASGHHQNSASNFGQAGISSRVPQNYFSSENLTTAKQATYRMPASGSAGNANHVAGVSGQYPQARGQYSVGASSLPQSNSGLQPGYQAPFHRSTAASGDVSSYEHAIHRISKNKNTGDLNILKTQYGTSHQTVHQSPPPATAASQHLLSSWTLNKDAYHARHSPQIDSAVPSAQDYKSTARPGTGTVPYSTSQQPSEQKSNQSSPRYQIHNLPNTGKHSKSHTCWVICHLT